MVACDFGEKVDVAMVPLEEGRTVNSEWYTVICLCKSFGEIIKKDKQAMSDHSTLCKFRLTSTKLSVLITSEK